MKWIGAAAVIAVACGACSYHPEGDAKFDAACRAEDGWRVYQPDGVAASELGEPSAAVTVLDTTGGRRLDFSDWRDEGFDPHLLLAGAKAVVKPFFISGPYFFNYSELARENGPPGLYRFTIEPADNPRCSAFNSLMALDLQKSHGAGHTLAPPNIPDSNHCIAAERVGDASVTSIKTMYVHADYSSEEDKRLGIVRQRRGLWDRSKGWIAAVNSITMVGFYGDAGFESCRQRAPAVRDVGSEILKYIHWM